MELAPQAPAILLVEKDAVTLEMYRRELSKSFTVFALTDLRHVPEVLASHDIQALVIEPEIDRILVWQLIPALRATRPDHLLPVIICSTRDAGGAVLGREVARYLTKPVLPQRLRQITLEVLAAGAEP